MTEYELKYGCNPNQIPAKIFMDSGKNLPITILNGRPGYINLLDALNSWQLVSELTKATGLCSAASFKHVSPSGAALGIVMSTELKRACFVDDIEGIDDSPLACAYARARGVDRMSSFGDWIALSERCDKVTASIIAREVSDGVIAPDYSPEALEILKAKKKGAYNIIKIDSGYIPEKQEIKQVFGISFEQGRNDFEISTKLLENVVTGNFALPEVAKRDLMVSLITLKYTQSNSVCYAVDGQAIGVGAGQQSRIHCTRLAGGKADNWHLRQSQRVLELPFLPELPRAARDNVIDVYISEDCEDVIGDRAWRSFFTRQPEKLSLDEKRSYLSNIKGVSLGSDAFFPFDDNIIRAFRSGVSFIAQPGGSVRDEDVISKCKELGISMCFTGLRLFHH